MRLSLKCLKFGRQIEEVRSRELNDCGIRRSFVTKEPHERTRLTSHSNRYRSLSRLAETTLRCVTLFAALVFGSEANDGPHGA